MTTTENPIMRMVPIGDDLFFEYKSIHTDPILLDLKRLCQGPIGNMDTVKNFGAVSKIQGHRAKPGLEIINANPAFARDIENRFLRLGFSIYYPKYSELNLSLTFNYNRLGESFWSVGFISYRAVILTASWNDEEAINKAIDYFLNPQACEITFRLLDSASASLRLEEIAQLDQEDSPYKVIHKRLKRKEIK